MKQDIHTIYPLMSLLLIGPSGIGKSTSIRDMALNYLLPTVPEELKPQLITGKTTKEALHDDLMNNSHAIVLASELANTFSKEKYMEGMVPYVTDLLDLAPTSVRTKSGGLKTIKTPSVTIMGGSTKEWLQEQLPSTATAGGFLPRFFIVKEDYKYQKIADPESALTKGQRDELEAKRLHTFGVFRAFVDFHQGPIGFKDYEARDAYSAWYQSFTPDTGLLSPFAARAGVHILRLAILLALSRGKTEISAIEIRSAICLFDFSLSKLGEVVVPMSSQGKLLMKVLETIGEDELSEVSIKRAMRNYCSSNDVTMCLNSLQQSGDVRREGDMWRRIAGSK